MNETYNPFKPCPFCGNDIIDLLPQNNYGTPEWLIKCRVCGVKKTVFTKFKRQIYAEWNNRYDNNTSD